MPKPAAEFSPLTMMKSRANSGRRRGRFCITHARPALPTTSPQNGILTAGLPDRDDARLRWSEEWMEPVWPLALHYLRGPLTQVGTIYRYHGTGRDSPLGVIIGPRVFATCRAEQPHPSPYVVLSSRTATASMRAARLSIPAASTASVAAE